MPKKNHQSNLSKIVPTVHASACTMSLSTKRQKRHQTQPARFVLPKRFYEDDWLELLIHFHSEMARLGLTKEKDLAPYQSEVLHEIQYALDEQHLANMHELWMFDLNRPHAMDRQFKPRIELTVGMTSKNNLIVTWEPAGLIAGQPGPTCDWRAWYVVQYPNFRPSNELLYVRDFGFALNTYTAHLSPIKRPKAPLSRTVKELSDDFSLKRWRSDYLRKRRDKDSALLMMAAAIVDGLKQRLQCRFNVTMITEIECELEGVPRGGEYEARVKRWEIVNVAERTRKREEAELLSLPAELECPIEVFADALRNASKPQSSGPAPVRISDETISRRLKKAGYAKLSVGRVSRYRHLLEKLRSDLLSAATDSKVVSINSRLKPGT